MEKQAYNWLNKNQLSYDIWEKKYRYNNESFPEWLERVSGGDEEVARLIEDKKFLFGGRILSNRGLDKYGEKITLSNCFAYDTEIVTNEGIKQIGDLCGKNIKVLSYGTWRDATVKNFGRQKMIKLNLKKGKAVKSFYVTEDHIWYVHNNKGYKTVKTIDLKTGDELPTDAIKFYHNYYPSPFGVAHGAFCGDGSHTGEYRCMNFCGDKEELIPYFLPANIGNSGGVKTISGIPKLFYNMPSLNESSSYLYGWLAGYFATDGSIDDRGSCTISSSKRSDLEFVQDVLAVLGIPCEEIRVQNRLSNLTGKYSDIFIITLNKNYLNESFFILSKHKKRFLENPPVRNDRWKVDNIDHDHGFIDDVYCVVEPCKHSFSLKGNILTHNCYVITPPDDSIESIFECAKKLARTYSYGGGCGVDLSKLAPGGAKVNNAAKTTTGATSFMDLYSLVTGLICQNGRRGALMLSIDCHHPDLEEFIGIKSDLDRVTKANISVRITDDFMTAVKNRTDFELSFTREETGETIKKVVNAYDLFKKFSEMNWDYAEPGMLFWDRISNYNLVSEDPGFSYAGVNPCAEEPLPAGGSCLLGSINLSEFVRTDKEFDFDGFDHTVEIAIKALNDVLDEGLPLHPLKEQRDSVRDWRQIGLGIMGLADMLIKMEIRYGSKEAVEICDKIGFHMADTAIRTSAELTKLNGTYPKYKPCVMDSDYFKNNTSSATKRAVEIHGLHNSQLLTTAPTGSTSSMIGVSGGIEPIYANYYERKTESLHGHDEYYKVYTPIVKAYMDEHHLKDDSELPDFFVTAQTLDYKERIEMQGIWQDHIDASISSTVNVPNDFTVEDVEDLYMKAWERGLKGITIFRDGCKRTGILSTSSHDDDNKDSAITSMNDLPRGFIVKADDNCIGKKRTLITGCGSLHCVSLFDPVTGDLLETYLSKGSTGGCNNFMIGLSRMISLAARGGIDVYTIVDQLKSSGTCPSYAVRRATKRDTSKGSCCPVAIGNALIEMYEELQSELGLIEEKDTTVKPTSEQTSGNKPKCPECGETLIFEGGCNICKSCGWSKCD